MRMRTLTEVEQRSVKFVTYFHISKVWREQGYHFSRVAERKRARVANLPGRGLSI